MRRIAFVPALALAGVLLNSGGAFVHATESAPPAPETTSIPTPSPALPAADPAQSATTPPASAAPAAAPAQAATPAPVPAPTTPVPTVDSLAMAGVKLPLPALPVPDDGTFAQFLKTSARDIGRTCGTVESLGWTIDPKAEPKLESIVNATMNALRKSGFKIKEAKPASIKSDSMLGFTADKADKRLLLVWSALGPDAVLLLTCETSGGRK